MYYLNLYKHNGSKNGHQPGAIWVLPASAITALTNPLFIEYKQKIENSKAIPSKKNQKYIFSKNKK